MNSVYGSIWRKWDFHVHTPYSLLNNNFGFNPFDETTEAEFDTYIKELFTRAVQNNVEAIGITDYFLINGYQRIQEKYLKNDKKMKELFPDADLLDKIRKILVFPNIELRLSTFVGQDAHAINYHVIFSSDISAETIQSLFLSQLHIKSDNDNEFPLSIDGLTRLGRAYKEHNRYNGSDFLCGLEKATVHDQEIINVLRKSKEFQGNYLISIPVDEDLSRVPWAGRDYFARKLLYKQCNCYMTANERTIDWAIAKGKSDLEKNELISEFGALKPCIWGSDAHSYDRMFSPDNQRYCWIKADLTFEGLKQIIYEPAERVSIQKSIPEEKDPHQVIASITFNDYNFQLEPIVFNPALTCIIGGKSTGKSILLRELALKADPQEVVNREKEHKRNNFTVHNSTIKWKDGTSENRKIVYIPQTFLNRMVDNPEQQTEVGDIIHRVLVQDPSVKNACNKLNETNKETLSLVNQKIEYFIELKDETQNIENDILREGKSDVFFASIKILEEERHKLAEEVEITQGEIDRYSKLEKDISILTQQLSREENVLSQLQSMPEPKVIIPGYYRLDGKEVKLDFKEPLSDILSLVVSKIETLQQMLHKEWPALKEDIEAQITNSISHKKETLETCTKEYSKLKPKIERSDALQKLTRRIKAEQEHLAQANERELKIKQNKEKILELKQAIIDSIKTYRENSVQYCNSIKVAEALGDTNLKFEAQPVWKRTDFIDMISNIFNNRQFGKFRNKYGIDLTEIHSKSYDNKLLESIWNAIEADELQIKQGFDVKSVLQKLFSNWYNVHYVVTSGNDTIDQMSPGKKALTILELLIDLEKSKCPILIDQPEDDLDNRSIYNELVRYIKTKKKERQIIVVTHNANVVLGADAEEVIIANQEGRDSPNKSKRFEYRSGAIENDEILFNEDDSPVDGVLNMKGVQTQICDILEGGHRAFEQRKNKYTSISR